jgi:hypothetical protein
VHLAHAVRRRDVVEVAADGPATRPLRMPCEPQVEREARTPAVGSDGQAGAQV